MASSGARGDAPLTQEEISSLFRTLRTTADPEVRRRLIEAHDSLAVHVAKEFWRAGEAMDDLIQVARIGLIGAVDRFDPDKGVKFPTFAIPTIRGEVKRHFRDRGWGIKVPRRLQDLSQKARQTAERLSHELGRPPSHAEIASALGEDEEDVIEAVELGHAYELLSLDVGAQDGGVAALLESRLGAQDATIEAVGETAQIERALESLPARDRSIIRLRYGTGLSQSEVARQLGISQMHVSRLERRALQHLRNLLRGSE